MIPCDVEAIVTNIFYVYCVAPVVHICTLLYTVDMPLCASLTRCAFAAVLPNLSLPSRVICTPDSLLHGPT